MAQREHFGGSSLHPGLTFPSAPHGLPLQCSPGLEAVAADESDDEPPPGVPSLKDIADLIEDDDSMKPSGLLTPWMFPDTQPHEAAERLTQQSWKKDFASPQTRHSQQQPHPQQQSRDGLFLTTPAPAPLSTTPPKLTAPNAGALASQAGPGHKGLFQGIKQFCVYCGQRVDPEYLTAKYCGYCGAERDLDQRNLNVLPTAGHVDTQGHVDSQDSYATWWSHDGSEIQKEDIAWGPADDFIIYSDKAADMWQSPGVGYSAHATYGGGGAWQMEDAYMGGSWGFQSHAAPYMTPSMA